MGVNDAAPRCRNRTQSKTSGSLITMGGIARCAVKNTNLRSVLRQQDRQFDPSNHEMTPGHAPATIGRTYGAPTFENTAEALKKFPRYGVLDCGTDRTTSAALPSR